MGKSNIQGSHLIIAAIILSAGAVLTAHVMTGNQLDWSWVMAIVVFTLVVHSNLR